MELTGLYRLTGRIFDFFRGGGGTVDGRGCGRGRSGSEGDCPAKLRPTTGAERGLYGIGQGKKQKPHHIGYGGVVFDGNPARLAVEFGVDGDGDVSRAFSILL